MAEQTSEVFGTVPNPSANFGNIPQGSEEFRNIRNGAERTEHHTLTVREVARLFEQAGVPRTERSIINWCRANRQGIARLDAFFDTNERKYFVTSQSVSLAIREEQAKAATGSPHESALPNRSEGKTKTAPDSGETEKLRLEVRDLQILNRGKDYFIDQLKMERDSFNGERQKYVERLMSFSRKVGELQTQLFQLGAPVVEIPKDSELSGSVQRDETVGHDVETLADTV